MSFILVKVHCFPALVGHSTLFFFKWTIPGLFVDLFLSFQTNITFWQQTNVRKCPSSIRCWDSNPRPLEHESLRVTTRPGLLPSTSFFVTAFEPASLIWRKRFSTRAKSDSLTSGSTSRVWRISWQRWSIRPLSSSTSISKALTAQTRELSWWNYWRRQSQLFTL